MGAAQNSPIGQSINEQTNGDSYLPSISDKEKWDAAQLGSIPLGGYNASTNTPNLVATLIENGQVLDVIVPGTITLNATQIPVNFGDQLKKTEAGIIHIPKPDIDIDSQTYTGTNLFDKSKIVSGYLLNGPSGAANADQATSAISDYIEVLSITDYVISGRGGNQTVVFYDANRNIQSDLKPGTTNGWQDLVGVNGTFKTGIDTKYIRLNVSFRGTGSADTLQVQKGTVATSYESFSRQTYIKAIKGGKIEAARLAEKTIIEGIATKENEVLNLASLKTYAPLKSDLPIITETVILSRNLFNAATIVSPAILDNSAGTQSTDGGNTGSAISDYISVSADTDYYISGRTSNPATAVLVYYDAQKAIITSAKPSGGWGSLPANGVYHTPVGCAFVRFNVSFRVSSAAAAAALIQFEKGSAATAYVAYSETRTVSKINNRGLEAEKINPAATYEKAATQDGDIVNLATLKSYAPTKTEVAKTLQTTVGKNIFNAATVVAGYLLNGPSGVANPDQTTSLISDYIPVSASTAYTISGRGGNQVVVFYDASKAIQTALKPGTTNGWQDITGVNGSFTTGVDTAFIRMNISFRGTGSASTVQVEKGNAATVYEAYKETNYIKSIGGIGLQASSIAEGAKMGASQVATKADLDNITISVKQKLSAPWSNQFPDISLPRTRAKIAAQIEDVEVVLLGNSLFALQNAASVVTEASPANLPPGCIYNHVQYQLWKHAVKNKPQYDRYDSQVNAFTLSGTWTASNTSKFDTPDWAGEFRTGGSNTYESSAANASVSFSWNLATYEKLNLIHRKDVDGVTAATIAISGGNGQVQVHDGTSWVEANGFVFSERTTQDAQGSGNAWHLGNWKLKMRRVATTGTVTVTVSKGDNSDYLYFWGTERWNGASLFITNVARAGRHFSLLRNNFLNDVIGRKPDLILFEFPIVNEMSAFAGPTTPGSKGYQRIVNNAQDFLFGDRTGAVSTLNLKNYTGNFSEIEVVGILPHFRQQYLSANRFLNYTSDAQNNGDDTYYGVENRVRSLVTSKGGPQILDMMKVYMNAATFLGWTYEQSVTPSTQTSQSSFSNDTVHQNDLGAYLWAKALAPLLEP